MDISGKDDNDEHLLNIKPILVNLIVFHFEISGKLDNNDEQSLNIELILTTLLLFHLDISGKDDNDDQTLSI